MDVFENEFALYILVSFISAAFFQWLYQGAASRILRSIIPKEYDALDIKRRNISCSALCSMVNATIMFTTSLYLLLTHNLHKNICWTNDIATRLLSCVELGAYFTDTVVLLRGKTETNIAPYILHHIAIVFGSYISLGYGVFAYFLCLRGINELSVPFQHARQILYDIGWKNERIYLINGLCFLFTFFISRICLIPITIYSVYTIWGTMEFARVNLFCKIVFLGGAVSIDSLNVYWFCLISRGAYKILMKNKHP